VKLLSAINLWPVGVGWGKIKRRPISLNGGAFALIIILILPVLSVAAGYGYYSISRANIILFNNNGILLIIVHKRGGHGEVYWVRETPTVQANAEKIVSRQLL
jgi:hypothetical protein